MDEIVKQLETVMRYHEETKHHFNRYARALGYMDWANQPNPFRRYEGATLGRLPILSPDEEPLSPPYADLYRSGAVSSAPVTIRTLSRLFEYALALSAWKQAGGTRWALRSNPSSGNLHPTEGYLLIGAVPGVAFTPGLYHYAPREHGLERRADCPDELLGELLHAFPPQAFLVGLSSIHWREAWKYGERAFRYCQHDTGHAIATVRIAAATLGWAAVVLHCLADETVEDVLGLNRTDDFAGAEREHPDLVMVVWPTDLARDWRTGDNHVLPLFLDPALVSEMTKQRWYGKANRLSPDDPVPWEALPWDPTIHLALFVHRVDGLDPGLYMLARDPGKVDKLKHAMHERFAWTTPPGCPPDLPLYLLEHGDAKRLASQVSCFQDIAGDGAFSLGMIAEYQEALFKHGPWFYRRLFWETGVIGQVLYLEAEAAGGGGDGDRWLFHEPGAPALRPQEPPLPTPHPLTPRRPGGAPPPPPR